MYAPIITTVKRDKATGRATHTTANFADQPAKMARHYEWEGMGAVATASAKKSPAT
ncbi:hypothetical protein QTI33_32220 [Variovorax sp. J22P271]|uniref:hypothetical protein n=1 Tax=Variovorax davisae TaxID=3053515 RepID=UPI002575A40C|nr:hypothetical protein [Variovorax sp. J22P271]MDM0036840.1 hypothetical protein [Variovorax sp. J22P271]